MKTYEYQHIVSFEETNRAAFSWQGRCREMFLKDHAPEVLTELSQGLALATVRVSCEYYLELYAFDQVAIRMRLGALSQNRITMLFEYWRISDLEEELIAKGEQQTASMRREGEKLIPTSVPTALKEALELYR